MISLVNEFSALLDTCTIVPISLCGLLLRLAEEPAMYRPKWSPEILLELKRTLEGPQYNLKPEKAAYRIACMESAFPEALIRKFGIERLSTDQFLVHQWHLDPKLVHRRVMEQAASETRDLDSHLAFLQKMVPEFVSLIRSQ